MFVDNHNRAGHAKPQQCTAARMVAHEKPTAPGRRQNKAAPARAVLLPRVVSPPRRMLHTDAAAVWRLTDTSRRYNTTGAGKRGQYRHTDKSPARMGAPRVEAIPYAPPQIWTTRTIRTTPERECPAPYRAARGERPKASTLQKGAKHHPPERNTRGGGGLFCSSQKKANRRGKSKRAGAGIEPPPKDKKRTAAVLRLHTQPKAPAPLCGDYTTANKRPPPFVGDGRNQRINSINLISNSLFTQRQR